MKHVLVTGGNGFIGGYVVEELRQRGYSPSVFDRHWVEATERPHYFGDIKDGTLVDDAVAHVDGVIHLAGVLGTQETVADPKPAAETNILGGLNVITACAKYDVPLVNIAVGNYWMHNTYSITKNAVERFVKMKRMYEGKVMTSVRALNAYGPRQVPSQPFGPSRVRKIMPSFVCRALTGNTIQVYGLGDQVMDMIYVEDVAEVLVSTLEHLEQGDIPTRTVQAGTGRHTTVKDIADAVVGAVLNSSDNQMPSVEYLPMRPGEPPSSVVVGDPETLEQVGVDPELLVKLEDGVIQTVDYFREYLAAKP